MDFEGKGIEYRIIRKFGKTSSGDSLKVIDIATGEPVEDIEPSIGEWLFGIDSEAFRKSVFISGDDMGRDISSTGLRNRLNSVVNEADDVRSFDDALKSLDTQRKEFLKARNGGSIADFTREIERAVVRLNASNESIREAVSLKTSATDLGKKIDSLSFSIEGLRKELQEKQKVASDKEAALSLRKKLSDAVNHIEQELKAFNNGHDGTFPDYERVEDARRAVGAMRKDSETLNTLSAQLSSLAAQQSRLQESVGGKILTAEEIEDLRNLLDDIVSANKELESMASSSENLNPEIEAFVDNPALIQKCESLVNRWDDILDAQRKLTNAERDRAILETRLADQKRRAEQLTQSLLTKRNELDALVGFDACDYSALSARLRALNNERLAASAGAVEDPFSTTAETSPEYEELLRIEDNGMMGYIRIPKIDVELPIYHGTSEPVLQVGAGHISTTSLPVGGASTHAVLTGHRGLPSKRLFTDLDQIVEGDIFYLKVLNETLAYKVDQILTVLPHETEALQIAEGEDYVTLVTCTPYGVNTHRLLIRGHRIPYVEAVAAVPDEIDHGLKIPFEVLVLLIALMILLVVFIIWRILARRKAMASGGEETAAGRAAARRRRRHSRRRRR